MRAWEAGPFENAADFVADFDDAPSVASIEASLEQIALAPADDYIEAPECSRAVAAAALITLTTAPATDVVGKASLAVRTVRSAGEKAQLASKARVALARIGANSELKELWDESDDEASREAWYASLTTLQNQLATF